MKNDDKWYSSKEKSLLKNTLTLKVVNEKTIMQEELKLNVTLIQPCTGIKLLLPSAMSAFWIGTINLSFIGSDNTHISCKFLIVSLLPYY